MKSHSKSRQNGSFSVGEARSPKELKQLAVSIAILEIIESEGLRGVTHSKVSRKSKVSRAWIYEYVGKEKKALIEFGAEVFAGHLARVALSDAPRSKEDLQRQVREGVKFLFDSVEANPLTIKLFFRFRGTANPVGTVIRKHEERWLKSAATTITRILGLDAEAASLLAESVLTLRLAFAHRIATAPRSAQTRQRAEKAFALIESAAATLAPSLD